MLYRLNDEFTKINQVEGLMQNMTQNSRIEVVACADNPQKDSGILLLPMEKLKFTAQTGEHIYARCAKIDGTIANLSIVNFKMPVLGSTNTGCACGSLIDDKTILLDKTWSSEKINETFTKYYTKTEIDNMISSGTGGNPGNYAQVTKIGITAPKTYALPITPTNTFNLPPAEILKFEQGTQDVLTTQCAFDNAEAYDFVIGGISGEKAKYVEFNGVMKPRTQYKINMSAPATLGSGYLSVSDEIDFADYKKVEAVERAKSISLIPNLVEGTAKITINGLNCLITKGIGCHVYSSYPLPPSKIYIEILAKSATSHTGISWFATSFGLANMNYTKYIRCYFSPESDYQISQLYNGVTTDEPAISCKRLEIGDVIGIAIDKVNKVMDFYMNGDKVTSVAIAADLLSGDALYLSISNLSGVADNEFDVNFGETPFKYSIPNGYTSFHLAIQKHYICLKDDNTAYGVNNSMFTKLTDNWLSLTDAEKIALFKLTNYEVPTVTDLATISKFKVFSYFDASDQPTYTITAVPKNQMVLPKGLISLESFEGIDQATLTSNLSQNAKCKILITTDLITYQTYDAINQVWQAVDHVNLTDVEKLGIDVSYLQNIPRAAWDILTAGKSGIGFAYLLSIEAVTDTCDIDKLELQVDMKGSWDKAVHGTDYKYGYPKNNVLTVSLLSDGDYKINYSKG